VATENKMHHIYIIKQRRQIDFDGTLFEYEELVGKCTSPDAAEKILDANPGAYISDDSVYTRDHLFLYE
jgi:hypothetical protein